MTAAVRNRLLLLGSAWGVLLAALPALVMTRHLSGFLVAALLVAALSGSVGTLVAGRRAATRRAGSGATLLSGLGTGFLQGLVAGAFAAFLIWALTALSISEFSLGDPSVLMSPRVFVGSFFVARSRSSSTRWPAAPCSAPPSGGSSTGP
jgi:ABC-type Mn2+/Zn2+ transport system permease subunit